jgi:outer membrane biosynthesis protein TonB
MMPIRSLTLLLACLSLLACEQPENPPQPVKATPVEASPVPELAPSKPAPAPKEPVRVVKPPAEPVAKPDAPVRRKPVAIRKAKPEEPQAALDLSLHSDVFDELPPLESPGDLPATLLPPMFGEKPEKQSPFGLHGRLITNDRVDDYLDSVEGAELQFEFKR